MNVDLSRGFGNFFKKIFALSIDMTQFHRKIIRTWYFMHFCSWNGAVGGVETAKMRRGSQGQFFLDKLDRAFAVERSHGFVIAPKQVIFEFFVQFFNTSELLPIIEITLVVPMTSLNLAIVPRCSRGDENVLDPQCRQSLVKWTKLGVTDEFVCKFGAVICLNGLYFERKCFYKHFQEAHTVLWCMLFEAIYKA